MTVVKWYTEFFIIWLNHFIKWGAASFCMQFYFLISFPLYVEQL